MDIADYNPIQTSEGSFLLKIKIRLWAVINRSVFRYSPFFCRGFRRWLLVLFGSSVSPSSSINRKAIIDYPWNLVIGNKSSIGRDSWIIAIDRVEIGEKTCIAPQVKIISGSHEIDSPGFNAITKPIKIGSCCWIGVGATILCGVSVGDWVIIGACSVVTKNIEPWNIVAGNPARFIKKREINPDE
jgi:putative colanic acid biosynthesis acetyltransferase WcaF